MRLVAPTAHLGLSSCTLYFGKNILVINQQIALLVANSPKKREHASCSNILLVWFGSSSKPGPHMKAVGAGATARHGVFSAWAVRNASPAASSYLDTSRNALRLHASFGWACPSLLHLALRELKRRTCVFFLRPGHEILGRWIPRTWALAHVHSGIQGSDRPKGSAPLVCTRAGIGDFL